MIFQSYKDMFSERPDDILGWLCKFGAHQRIQESGAEARVVTRDEFHGSCVAISDFLASCLLCSLNGVIDCNSIIEFMHSIRLSYSSLYSDFAYINLNAFLWLLAMLNSSCVFARQWKMHSAHMADIMRKLTLLLEQVSLSPCHNFCLTVMTLIMMLPPSCCCCSN
jgi:hypothetical protein